MCQFYGKINRGQVSRPLYGGCPLFGGSVIRGFTVFSSPTKSVGTRLLYSYVNAGAEWFFWDGPR